MVKINPLNGDHKTEKEEKEKKRKVGIPEEAFLYLHFKHSSPAFYPFALIKITTKI